MVGGLRKTHHRDRRQQGSSQDYPGGRLHEVSAQGNELKNLAQIYNANRGVSKD
jgi:hypothetical protein